MFIVYHYADLYIKLCWRQAHGTARSFYDVTGRVLADSHEKVFKQGMTLTPIEVVGTAHRGAEIIHTKLLTAGIY